MENNNVYDGVHESEEINFEELKQKFEELKNKSVEGYKINEILRHQSFLYAIEDCLELMEIIIELNAQCESDEAVILRLLDKFQVVKKLCAELKDCELSQLDMSDLEFLTIYFIPAINYKFKDGKGIKIMLISPKEIIGSKFVDEDRKRIH